MLRHFFFFYLVGGEEEEVEILMGLLPKKT